MEKIAEIMTKDVLTVPSDMPLKMAIDILVIRKISGLPVVDSRMELKGIITERDMMEVLLNKQSLEGKVVSDYMTTTVHSFSSSDTIVNVCKFLFDNPIRRVPIVDNNKLVGIVSRRDIIALLAKEENDE